MSGTLPTFRDNKDEETIHNTFTAVQIGASVLPTIHSKPTDNNKCKCNCPLPIFLPFGQYLLAWNGFLCIILVYSIVEIPYQVAFEINYTATSFIAIVGAFIDLCLLIDIVIAFRTAYIDKYDRLRIIHDPKLIAKRYLKTWFTIDILSAIPLTFIVIVFPEDEAKGSMLFVLFRLLRVIKLIRIAKILKTFHVFREHFHFIPNRNTKMILTLFKTLCLMLLIAHYFSCFWYAIGLWAHRYQMNSWIDIIVENGDENASNFHKYSYAFYWAIVTLFTTGYGDIHAFNIYEHWTCSIGILIGSIFFAYFVSILTSGLMDDLKHESKNERIEQCLEFCAHYNLPKEISRAVITHIRYYNSYNYLFDYETTMNALPNHLQMEISEHLATTVLKELDIFESLPMNIVGQIGLKLKSISVGENKFLYKAGDMGKELFIQRTGKSIFVGENNARHLKRGDVIGENCILSRRRQHSVMCQIWSEFFVLDIYDIVSVLKDNFELKDAQKEWNKIKTIIENSDSDHGDGHGMCEDLLYSKHRHVRFQTIDREDFQTFVAPGLNLSLSKVPKKSNLSTFSLEELALQQQDTEYRERDKKKKNRISFQSVTKLFSNMQKQTSHSRNKKVHSHYKKKGSSATLAYSHVVQNDMDVDDDYLFTTPTKDGNGSQWHSVRSAGFFNFSNNIMLDSDHDEKSECKNGKDQKQCKNNNGKYKRIVDDNKSEVVELQNIHSNSIGNTEGNVDVTPEKVNKKIEFS